MSIYMATTIKSTQVDLASMVSPASGNLLQAKADGLFAALEAAPNLQNQYVSSSTGSDSNPGTRAAPLKTVYAAITNLPDNTSGTIYLLEGDVFPIRRPTDPTSWGGTITNFGTAISTGNRNITFYPYGPQTDSYAGLEVNAVNFYSWLISGLNRPILEFGHYLYQGRPVGVSLVLGSAAGGFVALRGCEIRWTDAARASATSTGQAWAGAGYQWLLDLANTQIMGCVFPAPITKSDGSLLNNVIRTVGNAELWNCSLPVSSTQWGTVGNVTKLNLLDSGTMTDKNGTNYTPLPNSIITNISTRLGGITRDSNGAPRNLLANAVI